VVGVTRGVYGTCPPEAAEFRQWSSGVATRCLGWQAVAGSDRAAALVAGLEAAAAPLLASIEAVDDGLWNRVPKPGVWSIGKDAEHVAEAGVYHQWIVRLTIGEKVASRRPPIERAALTTSLTQRQAVDLIRRRTDQGIELIDGLTDDQLDLTTRPPRAGARILVVTIDLVLIGHYRVHRAEIDAKSRALG
jgi:uncharacterized damage-inducible protein DinB